MNGVDLSEALRVRPGSSVDLGAVDPAATHGRSKEASSKELERGLERLRDLQERLWAEHRRRVLVVLQGIDGAGKGGTIEHVVGAMNPAGVPVTSFKVPSEEERAHDYLWRLHKRVPGDGEIAVFDRSHYEDVLVVRVHELVPKERWSRRYDQINAFERLLADEGTTILKFFLWISKDEQQERLQARIDDPTKRWKFRLGDLDERKRWDSYVAAFEEALTRCSTDWAPWYVIPANRKWFRNLAVAEILAAELERLNPQYPPGEDLPAGLVVE
jgi:PPK2 family polyphosphate:nucleotide phosphotransferase